MNEGLPGLGSQSAGFGHVGEAGSCYAKMAQVLQRAGEVRDNVGGDSINVKKYVKEIAIMV